MIILSHKNCMDGLASAWVCKQVYPDAIIHFLQYGDALPVIPDSESVVMVDFSLSRDELESLHKRLGGRLVVLDHHRTAQEALANLPYAHFDMNECGATLAWKYFFPETKLPLLLEYVRDRDLWLWRQSNSREVSAALKLYPLTLEQFSAHMERFLRPESLTQENFDVHVNRGVNPFIREGTVALQYEANMVTSLANKAKLDYIDEHWIPCVNSPVLQSEIGERLCTLYSDSSFAAIYFDLDFRTRVFSLRSKGDFDVSAVAKKFGGGGHKNAAGFTIDVGKPVESEEYKEWRAKQIGK